VSVKWQDQAQRGWYEIEVLLQWMERQVMSHNLRRKPQAPTDESCLHKHYQQYPEEYQGVAMKRGFAARVLSSSFMISFTVIQKFIVLLILISANL